MNCFGKLVTAMVTPFNDDFSLDEEGTHNLVRYLIEVQKTDAILVCGTTGESPTMEREERARLFQIARKAAGGDCLVIGGTGTNNTRESMILSRAAQDAGLDGIMLVTPYYNKPPFEGLYEHFKRIADAVDLPVMIYNVPGRTALELSYDLIINLAENTYIKALKEAGNDLDKVACLEKQLGIRFSIYSGNDNMTLPMLALGAKGVVSVASHLVGPEIKSMIEHFQNGDVEKSRALHLKLLPVFKAMFITTNPIPVKTALNLKGVRVGPLRPPLAEAKGEEIETLVGVLKRIGSE